MSSYGQVYHGCYADGLGFLGIIMDAGHAEVWVGLRCDTPEEAFDDMKANAARHGVIDLRPWHAPEGEREEAVRKSRRDAEAVAERRKREAEYLAKKQAAGVA